MLEAVKNDWHQRPWWMNLIFYFCVYMTFVYSPWDIFFKPFAEAEDIWFGFTLRGWAAKIGEPIHWLIYAFGAYGFWKMKPWMWPWAAVYSAQVTIAMVVFNIISGPDYGDPRGGGWLASLLTGAALATLTYYLWRAKPLFTGETLAHEIVPEPHEDASKDET
jgi:hypothetical protein